MNMDTGMSDTKSELIPFFSPRSVAVVGASTTFAKWGTIIFHNILLGGFTGGIYPVNRNQREIFGLPAYKSLADIPGPVDLLMVIVPTEKVIGILHEAGEKGIKAAVIITAGYSETGADGRRLEEETIRVARQHGIRVLGPNCMGMVSMPVRLTAWMPSHIPETGGVSVVTQSGNMGTSISTSVVRRGLGIARVVSTGNEADLTTVDVIDYLIGRPRDRHNPVVYRGCGRRVRPPEKPQAGLPKKARHRHQGGQHDSRRPGQLLPYGGDGRQR